MIGASVIKHAREFKRYIRNFQYERTESGLYFPRARALFRGSYTHWVSGAPEYAMTDRNLIVDEGLNYLLNVGLDGGSQLSSWYIMLHSGSGTPTASLTAANYNATLSEITSASEGYTEGTRVAWSNDSVDTVNTEVVNDTTPASFTIATASSLDVNGAAMTSVSTKGSTSGTLMSAVKFSATRSFADTDVFNLKYKVDFDAV